MAGLVKVPEGVEAWRNCSAGLFVFGVPQSSGPDRLMRIHGGKDFRLTADLREQLQSRIANPKNDPFVNGRLKRVDDRQAPARDGGSEEAVAGAPRDPVEAVDGKTALPEGYDPEVALDEDDLRSFFEDNKHGRSFASALDKLSEGQLRRLLELAEDEDSGVNATLKQHQKLSEVLAEKFPHGKTSTSVAELSD